MDNTPPPLPPSFTENKPSFHHKAAKYAVAALGAAFLVNLTAQFPAGGGNPSVSRVVSLIGGMLFLSAIPAGVVALCGIRKHGCRYLLWRGLAGILVPVLLMGMAIPAFLKVRSAVSNRYIENVAAQINKSAPKMIDEVTRLDRATVGPGKLLTVHITITSLTADTLDRAGWDSDVRPALKKGILASLAKERPPNDSTIIYRYSGADGVKIDEISVSGQDLP